MKKSFYIIILSLCVAACSTEEQRAEEQRAETAANWKKINDGNEKALKEGNLRPKWSKTKDAK